MDFTLDEEQTAVSELTSRIVDDHTDNTRLRRMDADGVSHDAELWAALSDADLVGLSLPTGASGGGYGLVEAALVAEAIGRGPGLVPYAEVVAAGRALARAGHPRAETVATGTVVVPALTEGPTAAAPIRPTTTVSERASGCTITGEKRLVPGTTSASAVVVSATGGDGPGLFVVDVGAIPAGGIVRSTSTTGQSLASFRFDETPAERLDGSGAEALHALHHDLRVLRCAQLSGIAAGALTLAATHCTEREQFGAPIGTFQAVAHRMADAWLDTNLMVATSRQAAWRTDNALDAEQAAASAAMWASAGAHRVVHAAQHVHGGIGVDLDYPVHRFFRWAKDIELQLGGPGIGARGLGRLIASQPLTIG